VESMTLGGSGIPTDATGKKEIWGECARGLEAEVCKETEKKSVVRSGSVLKLRQAGGERKEEKKAH